MSSTQDQSKTPKIKAHLTDITRNNIGQVKLLVKNVIPVPYSETFYNETISNWPRENPCVKLAYHNEYLVGTVIARRETYNPADPTQKLTHLLPAEVIPSAKDRRKTGNTTHYRLYIAVLAVLEAYRQGGVGSTLIKDILDYADQHYDTFDEVYIHVHVGNTEGIKFYEKHGFTIAHTIEKYYRDDIVTPPDCHIMIRKTISPKTVKQFLEEPEPNNEIIE